LAVFRLGAKKYFVDSLALFNLRKQISISFTIGSDFLVAKLMKLEVFFLEKGVLSYVRIFLDFVDQNETILDDFLHESINLSILYRLRSFVHFFYDKLLFFAPFFLLFKN